MGIIGYTFFIGMFYFMLRTCFRELSRHDLHGDVVVLHSIAIIAVVALVIYCSGDPFLSYYDYAHAVWLLLLISEVARKATWGNRPAIRLMRHDRLRSASTTPTLHGFPSRSG
jgi:hypothetical protein